MHFLRKWGRIIHRDFGYLFFGASIIYGISGIALNHISDWNPNYTVELTEYSTTIDFKNTDKLRENIDQLLDDIGDRKDYKKHYFPKPGELKIFLSGGSSVVVDVTTGDVTAEILKRRPLFYQVNYLHYNPSHYWTWFSDIYAGALILLALSGLILIKGKKGITGRGAWLTAIGILVPILFLII
ncbi:MAG: PepSY-associated TM helix domain-containing protein [Bacteroidales bacterium]